MLPSLGSECDLMKSLQLLPGIQCSTEGSNQIVVRGGNPDQNLILLDDMPIYYSNHLGGLISIFNPYMIKDVKTIKGGFPAQYGGRLSSMIDIRTKDGNLKKYAGEIQLGIVSTVAAIEGPIIKDKVSFIFSVRKGMLDIYTGILSKINNETGIYNFYDFNLKVNGIISNRSRIYLNVYNGFDNTYISIKEISNNQLSQNIYQNKWGNSLAAIRWNYNVSNKIFANFSFIYSKYSFFNQLGNKLNIKEHVNVFDSKINTTYASQVYDLTTKADFDYYINNNLNLKFGATYSKRFFLPSTLKMYYTLNNSVINDTSIYSNIFNTNEFCLYLDNKIEINKITFMLGVRSAIYSTEKKQYYFIEPRIRSIVKISNNFNINFSISNTNQNTHLLIISGFWSSIRYVGTSN